VQSWWWSDLSKVCGKGEVDGWFQEALVWKLMLEINLDSGRMSRLAITSLLSCIHGCTLHP